MLVLAGPSGVGKGAVGRALLARDSHLAWSVSATTREPRPGELDGVDYHFWTRAEFERVRASDGFLEWFEVYGQLKGTPRQWVEDQLAAGMDVLLEIDVQGAVAVREQFPEALLVFLRAPSSAIQAERLRGRGSDDAAQVEQRLQMATTEEAVAASFDAVIINDDLGQAVEQLAAILGARRAGPPPDGIS